MPIIRVHTDDSTVDFTYRKDELIHNIAEEILLKGVWIKPNRLYPASRITFIEVLPE